MFIAIVIVAVGIWILVVAFTKPKPPHDTSNSYVWGGGLITFGVLLAFLARRWRNLVRTNPRYARIAGIMDVLKMTR
jgi:O-antigen/teichoic acid export membrane protein